MPSSDEKIIKIRKINIYESPILSVNHELKTVHIVLDTGATASLISKSKTDELKLKIYPTQHRAVQVDGVSNLKVLGEIHTEFKRGNLKLLFNALVVNELGTDLLGGTNFHKENDIYSRMAKDTIVIQGTHCFQSTPVEIMKLDENRSTAKLVSVKRATKAKNVKQASRSKRGRGGRGRGRGRGGKVPQDKMSRLANYFV